MNAKSLVNETEITKLNKLMNAQIMIQSQLQTDLFLKAI